MRVHIETEVDLDLELMAKAFAHMQSDEQAKFFSMAYREMGNYTKEQGAVGPQNTREKSKGELLFLDRFPRKAMEATSKEDASIYNMFSGQGLEVLSTTLRWPEVSRTSDPQVTCTCKATGVSVLGASVKVKTDRGPGTVAGKVVRVNAADNTVDVLLDRPEKTDEELVDWLKKGCDGGHLTTEDPIVRGPNIVWNSDSISLSDLDVLANADKTPNADICGECGDSGEWENPAGGRDAVTPCSRGCKKP